MAVPKIITDLVERFERNIESYKNIKYNETQVRREFIDPFFKALGWDVGNENGYAEAYKDVIHEFSLKTKDKAEAPDYLFRIGGIKKFFVEAKKPSVNLKEDISPAFQLRRYAWSAKLPLSILTDFEELVIYDCRIQPKKTDKSSTGRIKYFTYKNYVNSWDEIESIFSREAILKGSFDKYAETNKGKRGTAEVDDAFLKEIENWREILARNIALRNETLSNRELNFAVQKTIDRIIFLRICEDRGIEDYGQLMSLQNGANVYRRLLQIFTRADEKYNSGLFHFEKEKNRTEEPDKITQGISIDDKVLKEIIKNLYYPDSPYEFSVLPSDILGHVYEQFLGKVIRLTAGHRAVVEAKPEVKKAGGVYYTPTYIVDYIVKNTLGKKLEEIEEKLITGRSDPDLSGEESNKQINTQINKAIKEASKLKILDPACGSGSFLIGAYQFLLDWHLKIYTSVDFSYAKSLKKDTPLYQTKENEYRLTTAEKKRILLYNIFGVDIDNQAVEVTKLSLLLKVLEGETDESLNTQISMFRQRALPDLSNNIKCGNSLIGPDFYSQTELSLDDEERYRINVFDWESEFKEIMSSGGFDVVIGNPPFGNIFDRNTEKFYKENFIVEGRLEYFEMFIEQALILLNIVGNMSFIIPSTLLSNLYSRKLREFILNKVKLVEINIFSFGVFKDPTVHCTIIVLSNEYQNNNIVKVRSNIKNPLQLLNKFDYQIAQAYFRKEKNFVFNVLTPKTRDFFTRIETMTKRLGEIAYIRQCIKTGNDKKFVVNCDTELDNPWKATLKGRSINRYGIHETNLFLKYGDWLARNWKNKTFYEREKIAVRETGKRIVATIDIEHRYFLSSLYSVYFKDEKYNKDLYYLLGLINSNLATYIMTEIAYKLNQGAFTKIRTNQFANLPIVFPVTLYNQKKLKIKIESKVKHILKLNHKNQSTKTPQEKTAIHRQIDATDREIDRLVYELYSLTEEEIKIVEESVK